MMHSKGTELHHLGQCKPCAWQWRPTGLKVANYTPSPPPPCVYTYIINRLGAALGGRKTGRAEAPKSRQNLQNHCTVARNRLNRIDSTSKSLYCRSKSLKPRRQHRNCIDSTSKSLYCRLKSLKSRRQHFKMHPQHFKIIVLSFEIT